MTFEELKQVGELLLPAFRESVRPMLDAVVTEIKNAFRDHQQAVEERVDTNQQGIADLEKRLRKVEDRDNRILGIYTSVYAVFTFGTQIALHFWK